MALEVYYRPSSQWHPVYRPVVFQYRSDLYPNVTQRESNLPIIAIRNPTLAELSSYPQLDATDVLVEHAYQDPSAFYAGASIDIYNTSDGLYSGVYRVSERLTNELMVIDAEDVGIDTGGRFRIHYTNFTVFVEVLSENMTEPVTFTVMPTKDADGVDVFEVDVRDALARYFKDVKRIINPDNDTNATPFIAADGYITQVFSLSAYEGYDRVGFDGISRFQKYDDKAFRVNIADQIAVNSVQPYHETERDGDVRLDWYDGVDGFVLRDSVPSTTQRFLTQAQSLGQFLTGSDGHYLAFLWGGRRPVEAKVRVSYYSQPNAAGGFISSSTYRGEIYGRSCLVPMGPLNLGSVPGTALSYRVSVFNVNDIQLAETWTMNIVDCAGANVRMFYLNKMGGVDAFTFQGDQTRSLNVSRQIVSKPHMNTMPGLFNGDWQRRTWRTTNDRRYTIESGYLSPNMIRSIIEPLFESANVFTNIHPDWWTDVLIFTGQTPADGSRERKERMVLEYGLGVDNVSQRT